MFGKISRLKRQAVKHYTAYHILFDKYDCGKSLLNFISSDASFHKIEFNKTMDQLKEIDPSCPDFRL